MAFLHVTHTAYFPVYGHYSVITNAAQGAQTRSYVHLSY